LSPREADDPPAQYPVFREPWEAQAFALAVALGDKGVFSPAEWASALGSKLKAVDAAPQGDENAAYYHAWLAALEQLVADKALVALPVLAARTEAWGRAARATPHGSPILLENDPAADS
jgi:nitrile hydratase accessory protein